MPKIRRGEYTTSQRRAAVALVEGGLSMTAAAALVGVQIATMRRWCRRLGVESPFPSVTHSPQAKRRARELRAQGMPIMRVARLLAIRTATVREWVRDLGPGQPGNPGKGQAHRVLAMLREGVGYAEVERATGLGRSAIYWWARKLRRGQIPARYTPT